MTVDTPTEDWRVAFRRDTPVRLMSVHESEFRALVADMGTGPGWYSSAHLYGWYCNMKREDGFVPVSPIIFGKFLRLAGVRPSTRRIDGKPARGWMVGARWTRPAVPGAEPVMYPPDPEKS